MGKTNLHYGLESKLAFLLGERTLTENEIARIESLAATLPELRRKAKRLHDAISHASGLLAHIEPGWSPEDAPAPVIPNVHKAPTKMGRCSRAALEVLREAVAPLTVREIAVEVLVREGVEDPTPRDVTLTRNSVQTSLRAHRGSAVFRDGQFAQRWVSANNVGWIEVCNDAGDRKKAKTSE